MIKKRLWVLLTVALALGCLTGCGAGTNKKKDGLTVVTTIFPLYDWTENIVGDTASGVEVKLLLESGVDLHSYQPTASDIMTIGNSDVFIYVGGESDAWVTDALRNTANKNMIVLNLMDILGDALHEEELVEGMQGEEEPEGGEEEGPEYDEHIWLSLKNAKLLCDCIAEKLAEADPANADTYRANAKAYCEKLAEIDGRYEKTVSEADTKTLLFGDRFPFRYMTEDYKLKYYAAFIGCSAESEASFETIAFLAQKVDELSLKCVVALDGSDHKIAETIIRNTKSADQTIIEMNSLQSVTKKDIQNGTTYLSVMEDNLKALQEALK